MSNAMFAKGWVEGPRWQPLKSTLEALALVADVELQVTAVKGWFLQTVHYRATGDAEAVQDFRRRVHEYIDARNERLDRVFGGA